jgi:hypothetical protein
MTLKVATDTQFHSSRHVVYMDVVWTSIPVVQGWARANSTSLHTVLGHAYLQVRSIVGQCSVLAGIGFMFAGSVVLTYAEAAILVQSLLALRTTHNKLGSPYKAKWDHEVLLPFKNCRNSIELGKNLEIFSILKKSIFLFEKSNNRLSRNICIYLSCWF